MNFDKIKSDYPKAWERLSDWVHPQGKSFTYYPGIGWRSPMGNRDLYEFFDEFSVVVQMAYHIRPRQNLFKPFIYHSGKEEHIYDRFETRAAAESAAFEKAFEILENKLK